MKKKNLGAKQLEVETNAGINELLDRAADRLIQRLVAGAGPAEERVIVSRVLDERRDAKQAQASERRRKSSKDDENDKNRDVDWKSVEHTCPKCGRTGMVEPMFGIRTVRGTSHKHSYCVRCRGDKKYYKRVKTDHRLSRYRTL